jgi:serine/threonine-protein kinase
MLEPGGLPQDTTAPYLAEVIAGGRDLPLPRLVEVLRADQVRRWRAGQRVLAEAYLQAFPQLAASAEDALVLIGGEALLRLELGEAPPAAEYRDRFPQHADALQIHFELQAHLERTVPTHSRPRPAVEPALVPRIGQRALESEVRDLLRYRLLIAFAVTATGAAIRVGFIATSKFLAGDTSLVELLYGDLLGGRLVIIAVWTAITAVLASRRPLSLRQLRVLELVGFGVMLVIYGWGMYTFFRSDALWGYAAMGQDGILVLAVAAVGVWSFLIMLYCLFIPNTWRRCATVVAAIALTPFLAGAVAGFGPPDVAVSARVSFQLNFGFGLLLISIVGIFGSHKISTLQRRAIEAEARKLGPYQLNKRLGAGGMGEVYLAEHMLLKRPCAVKLIRPDRAGNPTELRRFEREVKATAALTHPNTIQVFDYGTAEDGTFYYAMEYLPGLNLEQLVEQHGPLPPARAVHLLRQLCGALQEAHAAGLIHRDIKPGNVIVGVRGGRHDVAKLLDFGLARAVSAGPDETRLTQEGAIAGTPAFMSPEQAGGLENLDGRSDIYSLGALAYFLLAGQPPFASRPMIQVLLAHISEPPKPLTEHRPDTPADLEAVVLRCLAKDPAQRYPDVQSLDSALAGCAAAGAWTEAEAAAWWSSRLNSSGGTGPRLEEAATVAAQAGGRP